MTATIVSIALVRSAPGRRRVIHSNTSNGANGSPSTSLPTMRRATATRLTAAPSRSPEKTDLRFIGCKACKKHTCSTVPPSRPLRRSRPRRPRHPHRRTRAAPLSRGSTDIERFDIDFAKSGLSERRLATVVYGRNVTFEWSRA